MKKYHIIDNCKYLIISILIIVCDQILKRYIIDNFKLGQSQEIIPGLLSFTYLRNTGAAWNLLAGKMNLFYIISILALIVVIYYLFSLKYSHRFFKFGLAMVLGGIVGNFIDRLIFKYVIDMVDLDFINFNIFNLADCAITFGVIFIFYYFVFLVEKEN